MSPAQKDKRHTKATKVLRTERDASKTRRSSNHSPMLKSSSSPPHVPPRRAIVATISSPAPARRVSVASPSISQSSSPTTKPSPTAKPVLPSPASKPLPTVKSSSPSTRPGWVPPPAKSSPSQIPTPKFVTTERRKSGSPCLETKKKTTGIHISRTEFGIDETDIPASIITGVQRRSVIAPALDKSEKKGRKDSRPQGLGLSFGGVDDGGNIVDGTVSTMKARSGHLRLVSVSSLTNASMKGGKKFNDNDDDDDKDEQEKRDSLSPITSTNPVTPTNVFPNHNTRFEHTSHLCPPPPLPSTLPPSPSLLHPYISGIHISPSCTSGSLTHRLVCGHLILTATPEHCLRNCVITKTTFGTARPKAQGFVANARGLDEKWGCPCCAVEEAEEGQAKNCVAVLGREMCGEDRQDGMKRQKEMVDVESDLNTKGFVLHQSR